MQNKMLRELIRFMASDAKMVLAAGDEESREIVERHEEEIVSYIERLEHENARLRGSLS